MCALRVLSGVLVPRAGSRTNGSATVTFDPPAITGDADGVELNVSGAAGRFEQPPGKLVAVRDFRVGDKDTFFGGSQTDMFVVNDDAPTQDLMTIRWNTSGGGEIRELSVLIMGEA
jgi:hypothetical protein